MRRAAETIGALLLLLASDCLAFPEPMRPAPAARAEPARGGNAWASSAGLASWYGPRHHGKRTASGERFDMHALTAAHRTLPLGSHVRVTNLANGQSVVVRLNDRGPYVAGRVLDLSYRAGRSLGMLRWGVVPVRIDLLTASEGSAAPTPSQAPLARIAEPRVRRAT